jgi:hypothetical protein
MVKKVLFILILLLFVIPFSQACITLDKYRQEFLPGETMQVEVDVDPGMNIARDIYYNDLYLYDSNDYLISGNFFITKISKSKFFIWFDVPNVKGDYKLRVRAICGNSELVATDFKVLESKNFYYSSLKNQVSGKWPSLTLEENIMTGAALFFDEELSEDALETFFNRRDSCIKTNCSTKNASLAIISFKDFSTRSQMKDMLEAYQNNLKGDWKVEFVSGISESCNLSVGNDTTLINTFPGKNNFDIDFSDYMNNKQVLISDTCNLNSRKLIFSYKGFTKNFSMGNNFLISNIGCFGNNIKNTCDPDSTAYALFSLKLAGFSITNQNSAIEWLSDNANSVDQIAILYYLTGDESRLNQVLSSQNYNGAWQKNGANDVRVTVMNYYILNSRNKTYEVIEALDKANDYLEGKLSTSTLLEKSYMLYFVFPNVEPFMSIWPGVVKVNSQSSFSIILQNKGTEKIKGQIRFMNFTDDFQMDENSMKNLQVSVPRIETPGGIAIGEVMQLIYSDDIPNSIFRTYDIPIIIFTFNGTGTYFGNFTINDTNINGSQRGNIINGTVNDPEYNKTANLSGDLITKNFYFNPLSLNNTFFTEDTVTLSAVLTNKFPDSVKNIVVQPSVRLIELDLSPVNIEELKSGESKTILFYANPTDLDIRPGSKAEGFVTARGSYKGQDISTIVNLFFNSSVVENLNTCAEIGGKDCASENKFCKNSQFSSNRTSDLGLRCCISECENIKSPSKSRTLAVILVIAVIVILVAVLLIIKRKPKRDMKDFLDDISKEKQPGYTEGFDDVNQGNQQSQSGDFKKEFSDEDFQKFSQ